MENVVPIRPTTDLIQARRIATEFDALAVSLDIMLSLELRLVCDDLTEACAGMSEAEIESIIAPLTQCSATAVLLMRYRDQLDRSETSMKASERQRDALRAAVRRIAR